MAFSRRAGEGGGHSHHDPARYVSPPRPVSRLGELPEKVAGAEEERELHERRAFLDWKDIPRWSHLRDVDRVYLDPYINDRYAHNTTTVSPQAHI